MTQDPSLLEMRSDYDDEIQALINSDLLVLSVKPSLLLFILYTMTRIQIFLIHG